MNKILYYIFITFVAAVNFIAIKDFSIISILTTIIGYTILALIPLLEYFYTKILEKTNNDIFVKLFLINLGIFIFNVGYFNICRYENMKFPIILFAAIALSDILLLGISKIFKFNIRKLDKKAPIVILLLTMGVTSTVFYQYLNNVLEGDVNNHILSSKVFGVPKDLQDKGIKPFYLFDYECGWDGQFYYYIANDILAKKDTPAVILSDNGDDFNDNPQYRYARVGFELFSKMISKILMQDWVSPLMHLSVYFLLFLAAAYSFARFLRKLNKNAWLSLLWIFAAGNMLTMFAALPDAAADSFFILSLPFLYNFINEDKKRVFNGLMFVFFATFAVLSREVYCLFLFSLCVFSVYEFLKNKKIRWDIIFVSVIPVVIYVIWKIFLKIKLPEVILPPGESYVTFTKLVGFPSLALIKYTFTHSEWYNRLLLPLFTVILVISAILGLKNIKQNNNIFNNSIALTLILMTALYLFFGDTVMFHWTGYWKAIGPILILLILLVSDSDKKLYTTFSLFLIISIFIGHSVFFERYSHVVQPNQYRVITNSDFFQKKQEISCNKCFDNNDFEAKIIDYKIEKIGQRKFLKVKTVVTNKSGYLWESGPMQYAANIGGVWVDENNEPKEYSERTFIVGGLDNDKSKEVYIVSVLPKKYKKMKFFISPLQESCAWCYMTNKLNNTYIDFKGEK